MGRQVCLTMPSFLQAKYLEKFGFDLVNLHQFKCYHVGLEFIIGLLCTC